MSTSPAAAAIEITALRKAFGATTVLNGLDLSVPGGSITALLGPSGCGKTTVLRSIAGCTTPDSGTISGNGRQVSGPGRDVPARLRQVGYVAQEGALFPHRDVAANISFGLPRSGLRPRARAHAARIDELLELVGLGPEIRHRAPHQLSGGQQQRVALARALAPRPAVMLLDEPFSSLDAQLREETARATVAALREAGVTALLVTHDAREALSMADSVAVLHRGVVAQHAGPEEVYQRPACAAVGRALGHANLLAATVTGRVAHTTLGDLWLEAAPVGPAAAQDVLIRPEQVRFVRPDERDAVPGVIFDIAYYGHDCVARVRLEDGTLLAARTPTDVVPAVGDRVDVSVVGVVHALPR